MQSNQTKLFIDNNGNAHMFFHQNNTIYTKQITKDNFSPACVVIKDVIPSFSISSDNGKAIVTAQRSNGDIYICRQGKDKWTEKHFLRSACNSNTKLYVHPNNDRINIIFNHIDNMGIESINALSVSNKSLSAPFKIDDIIPLSTSPYNIITVTPFHILLIYTDTTRRITLREAFLSPLKIGSPVHISKEMTFLADISSTIANDIIHIAYIRKERRSNQLIYIQKNAAGLSEAISIWENPRIKSCMICTEKNRIYIYCTVGTNVFCSFSDNQGGSFCPVFKHNFKLSSSSVKTEIINASSVFQCSSEAFADPVSNSIELPAYISKDASVKANIPEKQETKTFSDEVEIYKNKASLYEKQLNEANKKISELSRKLSQRNEELYTINSRWMRKLNSLTPTQEKNKALPVVINGTPPQEVSSP